MATVAARARHSAGRDGVRDAVEASISTIETFLWSEIGAARGSRDQETAPVSRSAASVAAAETWHLRDVGDLFDSTSQNERARFSMADRPIERLNVSAAATLAALRETGAVSWSRDPRAAPISLHKNVSIVEIDASTTSRTPSRPAECRARAATVAMPGCRLDEYGCRSAEDENALYDYHWLLEGQPNGTAFNQTTLEPTKVSLTFFAANTTYCPVSDPVCSQCRATFQRYATSSKTVGSLHDQFCVGEGGCVYIAACEAPGLFEVRAADQMCEKQFYEMPRAKSLPNATSTHRDPRAPPARPMTHRIEDSCGYYSQKDVRGCRAPRTCRDCLRKEGCMINDYQCVSMDKYEYVLDFRNTTRPSEVFITLENGSTLLVNPVYQFPSINTTYCPPADPACVTCDHAFDYLFEGARHTNTFCVGASGCVCVAQCAESEGHRVSLQDECRVGSNRDDSNIFIGLVVMAIVIAFFVLFFSRRTNDSPPARRLYPATRILQPAAQLLRNMLDQAPALTLDLYGWHQFHRRMLEKEEELLAGAENVSPATRLVDFEFAAPSAPDFDEDESSAPSSSDPRALASAPVFRAEDTTSQSNGPGSGADSIMEPYVSRDPEPSTPTAPEFHESV